MKDIYQVPYNSNFFRYPDERWVDIPGFEGLYQFSNRYRFKNLERRINCGYGKTRVIPEKIIKLNYSGAYPVAQLWKNNKAHHLRVHILVCVISFENPGNKPEVNHKDGDKTNFIWWNLEWNTVSENKNHAYANGLMVARDLSGTNNPRAKLTPVHVKTIRDCFSTGKYTKVFLGKLFSVDPSVITDIINRKIWAKVA